ncbi:MAG: hypothetical protein ACRDGS_15810, partial [Chloroflexota bacterium]
MVQDDVSHLFGDDQPSMPVIGSFIRPLWVFADEYPVLMSEWLKVVATVNMDGLDVMLTRNGGIFIEIPAEYHDIQGNYRAGNDAERLEFQGRVLLAFNQILCAYALTGIMTEPVTAIHLGRGKMAGGCAVVLNGGGGGGIERTVDPYTLLLKGKTEYWSRISAFTMELATDESNLSDLRLLTQVSPHAPLFVLIAYNALSVELYSESLVNAWFAVELWIGHTWTQLRKVSPSGLHRLQSRGRLPAVYD